MPHKPSKRKKPHLLTTEETIVPISKTALSVAGQSSMFSNARSAHITGGSFNIITKVNTDDGTSLNLLYMSVAPNAILNAGGRADEVRCHPGTREEVIDRIEKWSDTQDDHAAPMFWLSGPAGAGKSAIMQTVAERCKTRGMPQANFFFFRADTSRSDASPFIATLVHQIILLYPSLRDPVATLVTKNPLIFNSSLDDQLAQLIVAPMSSTSQPSLPHRPLLLVIDGLDECDSESKRSQQQLLRAFDKVLSHQTGATLFRLLVASRDESQIRAAFNGISSECVHLYLDNQYFPENDIRVFVNNKFEEVRKTHPLAYILGENWPSAEDIDYIVDKSSGHFIYAATVMRFILDSSASPKISLERVQGAARLVTKSPFAHLDAIYTYILNQVNDQEAVKDILRAQLLLTRLTSLSHEKLRYGTPEPLEVPLIALLQRYNPKYTEELVLSCLADLTPLAWYASHSHKLLFHHASFPDYLLDGSRSRDYFVDLTAFNYQILPIAWQLLQNRELDDIAVWVQFSIIGILALRRLPPTLLDTLVLSQWVWPQIQWDTKTLIFRAIHKLCITTEDVNNYQRFIRGWIDRLNEAGYNIVEGIPFGRRYFYMARAGSFHMLDYTMDTALRPITDFDRQETAEWLTALLHRAHKEVYPQDPKRYERLLKDWIEWANENEIPYEGLDNLPNAWKYFEGNTTKNWVTSKFKSVISRVRK